MRVQPDAVATRRRAELPKNRRLPPTLRVELQMPLEESRPKPRPQVVTAGVKQRRRLIPAAHQRSPRRQTSKTARTAAVRSRASPGSSTKTPSVGKSKRIPRRSPRQRQPIRHQPVSPASTPATDQTAPARQAAPAPPSQAEHRTGQTPHPPPTTPTRRPDPPRLQPQLSLARHLPRRPRPRPPRIEAISGLARGHRLIARRSASSIPYSSKQRSSISAWISSNSASTARTRSAHASARSASESPFTMQQRRQHKRMRHLDPRIQAPASTTKHGELKNASAASSSRGSGWHG